MNIKELFNKKIKLKEEINSIDNEIYSKINHWLSMALPEGSNYKWYGDYYFPYDDQEHVEITVFENGITHSIKANIDEII